MKNVITSLVIYLTTTISLGSEFCSQPFKELCKNSPSGLVGYNAAKREFSRIEGLGHLATKALLLNNSMNHCYDGEDETIKEQCKKIKKSEMARHLFTPERVAKARALFSRAVLKMKAYINYRKTQFPDGSVKEIGLREVINILNKAELKFDTYRKDEEFDFNAAASSFHNENPSVKLHGMITLVDSAPDSLFHILLHEIGHLFDPGSFPGTESDLTYQAHPFSEELKCLHRTDSAQTMRGDGVCFAKAVDDAKKLGIEIPYGAKLGKETYYQTESNRSVAVHYILWPDQLTKCAVPQIHEAFADWISAEALFFDLNKGIDLPAFTRSHLAWLCAGEKTSLSLDELEKERFENRIYSHLTTFDRVQNNLLANSEFRKGMSCGVDLSIKSMDDQDVFMGRNGSHPRTTGIYCGSHLNDGRPAVYPNTIEGFLRHHKWWSKFF